MFKSDLTLKNTQTPGVKGATGTEINSVALSFVSSPLHNTWWAHTLSAEPVQSEHSMGHLESKSSVHHLKTAAFNGAQTAFVPRIA